MTPLLYAYVTQTQESCSRPGATRAPGSLILVRRHGAQVPAACAAARASASFAAFSASRCPLWCTWPRTWLSSPSECPAPSGSALPRRTPQPRASAQPRRRCKRVSHSRARESKSSAALTQREGASDARRTLGVGHAVLLLERHLGQRAVGLPARRAPLSARGDARPRVPAQRTAPRTCCTVRRDRKSPCPWSRRRCRPGTPAAAPRGRFVSAQRPPKQARP